MNSVTPMRLVPVINNTSTNVNKEFPSVSETQFSIKKQNTAGNLTNLDSELLEILHNKDLSDDAKAKLYWIALHKAEVYKDKSMWSEPTIVELRENRFIPIPVMKSTTSTPKPIITSESQNVIDNLNKKRKADFNDSEEIKTKRRNIESLAKSLTQRAQKRKSDIDDSNFQLKRMALVNRIQNGHITDEEIEKNLETEREPIIESEPVNEIREEDDVTSVSGPLVVVNQQDEYQPPSTSSFNYTPKEFSVSDNLSQKLQPDWLKQFYDKLESFPATHQFKIESLIRKILEKDSKFKIDRNSVSTSQNLLIRGDPVQLFLGFVRGRNSRNITLLKNYLQNLQIEYQFGSGMKIKKWVKL